MTNVVNLPVEYKLPATIRGDEIWASPKPSDLMTWEVCRYIRRESMSCRGCPEWTEDPHYGPVKAGCRMWAEEACRVMMAVQRREGETKA